MDKIKTPHNRTRILGAFLLYSMKGKFMTKTVKRQELISHTYNDFEFKQRSVDGYVDATALCTANGKKSNDYFRSQDSQEFVDELILTTGIPAIKLIEKKEGRYGGTFVHPLIANDIARWCSAAFDRHVDILPQSQKKIVLKRSQAVLA